MIPILFQQKKVQLQFRNSDATGSFSYKDDHSKWAISEAADGPNLVCIGDINRMKSQESRGGGATCISNAVVWQTFKSLVGEKEMC